MWMLIALVVVFSIAFIRMIIDLAKSDKPKKKPEAAAPDQINMLPDAINRDLQARLDMYRQARNAMQQQHQQLMQQQLAALQQPAFGPNLLGGITGSLPPQGIMGGSGGANSPPWSAGGISDGSSPAAKIAQIAAQAGLTPQEVELILRPVSGGIRPDPLSPVIAGLRMLPSCLKGLPDLSVPNTLGWRWWVWSPQHVRLLSPHRGTVWFDPELRCPKWDQSDVLRGVAGIHARLVPLDWTRASTSDVIPPMPWTKCPSDKHGDNLATASWLAPRVTGIVERMPGHYVLGTIGWRAEWVMIKKLCAPSPDMAILLKHAYPDVEVIDGHR